MISRIMGALNERRRALRNSDQGFTLIELLVVVVIIGILAAIAIPVYLGVQNNAKDSAAKSDLTSAKTAIIAFQTDQGTYPADLSSGTLGTYGFTQSSNTKSIGYTAPTATATTFCVTAKSVTNKTFYVTDSIGVTAYTALPTGCKAPTP